MLHITYDGLMPRASSYALMSDEHFDYSYDPFYYLLMTNDERFLIISKPHKFTFVDILYIRRPKAIRSETFM